MNLCTRFTFSNLPLPLFSKEEYPLPFFRKVSVYYSHFYKGGYRGITEHNFQFSTKEPIYRMQKRHSSMKDVLYGK